METQVHRDQRKSLNFIMATYSKIPPQREGHVSVKKSKSGTGTQSSFGTQMPSRTVARRQHGISDMACFLEVHKPRLL